MVIAYGVRDSGRREVIGLDLGEIESEAFWIEFLRALRARGLAGVRLAVSDHHEGLKRAIVRVLAARGSSAPCTSSETCISTAVLASVGWSPPPYGRSSTPNTQSRRASASAQSSNASSRWPRRSPGSSRMPGAPLPGAFRPTYELVFAL